MGRGNPNPKNKYKSPYPQPLAKDMIGVRLPVELDSFVRSLPNRTEWLRGAIAAQYERDMQQLNSTNSGESVPESQCDPG